MKMDLTVRRDKERRDGIYFRHHNRHISDTLSLIKKIKILKKDLLTTANVVELGIFKNRSEERVIRKDNKGPKFSKYKCAGPQIYYSKNDLIEWLENSIVKKLYYLDENIEIIDRKISNIKSMKYNIFDMHDLVRLEIFNSISEIERARLFNAFPFITNLAKTRYSYPKKDLIIWLQESKDKYLIEISQIDEYLNKNKKAQVTYTNALDDPLDQSVSNDYLKKLYNLDIQLHECIHLFKNIYLENEKRL